MIFCGLESKTKKKTEELTQIVRECLRNEIALQLSRDLTTSSA